MKKIRTSLSLMAAAAFLSVTLFTSCGGKKDENSEEATEQMEGEHPAEEGEHPTEGGEHPAEDTTATDTTVSA